MTAMATNSYILNYKIGQTWKVDSNEQNTNLQVNWKTTQLLIRT